MLESRNNFLEIEYKNQGNLFWERVEGAKSEAFKEFAGKVKGLFNPDIAYDISREIDNLVKEMVGDAE